MNDLVLCINVGAGVNKQTGNVCVASHSGVVQRQVTSLHCHHTHTQHCTVLLLLLHLFNGLFYRTTWVCILDEIMGLRVRPDATVTTVSKH